jgi:hypothetical protein
MEKRIICECPYALAPRSISFLKFTQNHFFQFPLQLCRFSLVYYNPRLVGVLWFLFSGRGAFGFYGLSKWWREVLVALRANHSSAVSHINLSFRKIRTSNGPATPPDGPLLWAECARQMFCSTIDIKNARTQLQMRNDCAISQKSRICINARNWTIRTSPLSRKYEGFWRFLLQCYSYFREPG